MRLRPAPAEHQAAPPAINWTVAAAFIAALSLYLNSLMWWTEPPDVTWYLRPWFQHIVRYGPVGAFAHPFSNYTPTYLYLLAILSLFHGSMDAMYLIKLLSVAGTAFAAFGVAHLLKTMGGQQKQAMVLFILPSVAINAALLAQCDALWAGACVFAVSTMIRGSTKRSLVWCGVAIAFKLQSVFVAPFIVGALIGRRVPLWQWTIPGLVFAGLMLPAWLAGWPAKDLAMVYPSQPGFVPFPGRLANPWMFATIFAPDAAKNLYWLGFAGAAAASGLIVALTSTSTRNPRAMLLLALLSSLALPFFLPKMLERYYFLADLLAISLAFAYRSWPTILIAAAVQVASFLSIWTYMFYFYRPYPVLPGTAIATIALLATYVLARRAGAEWPRINPGPARPRPALDARTAA